MGIRTKAILRSLNAYFDYKIRREFRTNLRSGFRSSEPFSGSPIIIIGMHRSGTTLLSRLLRMSGVSMGAIRGKKTDESLFFQSLNNSLLRFGRASWDNPKPFIEAVQNDQTKVNLVQTLNSILHSPSTIFYNTRFRNLLPDKKYQWGWKDPRNTYTLPLWIDLFPNAKIIHIYRNGIDVANSLSSRTLKSPMKGDISLRTMSLDGSLDLWSQYVRRAVSNLELIPAKNKIEIRFEDLIQDPKNEMIRLMKFLNREIDDGILEEMIDKMNKKKVYAFLDDPELIDLYSERKNDDLFVELNYHNL